MNPIPPEIVNEFLWFLNRPFAPPDKWKTKEPNQARLKMALERNAFLVGGDEVKTVKRDSFFTCHDCGRPDGRKRFKEEIPLCDSCYASYLGATPEDI